MATSTLPPPVVAKAPLRTWSGALHVFFSRLTADPPAPWNRVTIGALISLIVIWAAWMYGTWADWGSVTIDCGREMYVPSLILQGKLLYRDIWYLYGPVAPYFNSYLFRIFGVNLGVLYWAGSLSALGSAILLYLSGKQLSSWLSGWTAGAVLLVQAFHPSLFSFPLPYSFASVYGCLTACFFVWVILQASSSQKRVWVFAAGTVAAFALLLKIEFGAACYVALAMLIAARGLQQRSWMLVMKDAAVTLPGIAVCAIVIRWMVSIGGFEFLTQENIMSWPTSYFMRTYGKFWLAASGLSITPAAFAKAAARTFTLVGVAQGVLLLATLKPTAKRAMVLRLILFLGCLAYLLIYVGWSEAALQLFFPQDTVLYVALAAIVAVFCFWRRPDNNRLLAVALLLAFSSLLASRMLLKMSPLQYSIYYDGPAILSLLLLVHAILPVARNSRRFIFRAELLIGLLCLAEALAWSRESAEIPWRNDAYLTTERGTIKLTKSKVEQYQAAIQFMKDKKALGQNVMSVPEDTSLYFFSGLNCPTRVFEFTPGILAPGKMTDETIQQIENGNVRYLIWSNRFFPEYETLQWGTDFDRPVGEYLRSHYRMVGPLRPGRVRFGEWTAFIWERKPEAGPQ